MEDKEVKQLVNKIFQMKGLPKVTNFAQEFSDGALFQTLFNILYEENINCRLSTSKLEADKLLNWNRLNAKICFNYLQQEFYLVKGTMRNLAQGKNQQVILKLLRILINTSQSNFGDLNLNDECIQDIADVITAETPGSVVGNEEMKDCKAFGTFIAGELSQDYFYKNTV